MGKATRGGRRHAHPIACGGVMVLLALVCALPVAAAADDPGAYLLHAAGCVACHTREDGEPLAGGRAFETPYGTFHSPNITPDPETGIGGWSLQQFVTALKQGLRPDGAAYYPVFPYPSYRQMSDADAAALYEHLQTRPPVVATNRENEPAWWLARWMMHPWQWWLLEAPPSITTDPALQRGQYLVDALGHCGECHTPRKATGVLDRSRYLAGNKDGPDGGKVPNITPHREHGIGKWSGDDLVYFLESGELPDGDYSGGAMTEVIDQGTSRLTAVDRAAIAAWLASIPARQDPD